jgi:hypothetical protein
VDPKLLQLGVRKLKNLANNTLLVECKSKTNHDILEKELRKLSTVTAERPKRKLPTLLLMFVAKEIEDTTIKDTIHQQTNLSQVEDTILNIKFTKRTFEVRRTLLSKSAHTCRGN